MLRGPTYSDISIFANGALTLDFTLGGSSTAILTFTNALAQGVVVSMTCGTSLHVWGGVGSLSNPTMVDFGCGKSYTVAPWTDGAIVIYNPSSIRIAAAVSTDLEKKSIWLPVLLGVAGGLILIGGIIGVVCWRRKKLARELETMNSK
jgi:hypothetical protein